MKHKYTEGLMQKRRNSSASAMELHLFCIKPSKYTVGLVQKTTPAHMSMG